MIGDAGARDQCECVCAGADGDDRCGPGPDGDDGRGCPDRMMNDDDGDG